MYSDNYSQGDFQRMRSDAIKRMQEMANKYPHSDDRIPVDYVGTMHNSKSVNNDEANVDNTENFTDAKQINLPQNDIDDKATFSDIHKPINSFSEKTKGLFKNIKEDDLILIGIFILLFNENKKDDYVMLLIIAILFFF